MSSATIKLFPVRGDAKRLRAAALSNRTGKAVAAPRIEFESLLGREEAGKSGVFLLAGTDPESGWPALYVGEAESLRERLHGHLDKDFWNHVRRLRHAESWMLHVARGNSASNWQGVEGVRS